MGLRVCAAVGCCVTTFNKMFCNKHKLAIDRDVSWRVLDDPSLSDVIVHQAIDWACDPVVEPAKREKAVVKWCPGPVPYYRAEHPDYWDGIGASPGSALRAMRPGDELPF